MATQILLTGATGYVGSHLLDELLRRDHTVRALARDPSKLAVTPSAQDSCHPKRGFGVTGEHGDGVTAVAGDAVTGAGLTEALAGCEVAYYLIHSMGGSGDDFERRDRAAAHNFGAAARDAGVRRVIYLGGLGEGSDHLSSRNEVADILAGYVPEPVHARAAMVIGPGSASFEMMRHLVNRLPVMITPRWIDTRTQPVAIRDVARALAELATRADAPHEVQLGGADVLTYREMMQRYAAIAGRRTPAVIKTPVLSPSLSSVWVALVTPVSRGLVRPLVDGLRAEMVVEQPPPPGINDDPLGFDDAVREALA